MSQRGFSINKLSKIGKTSPQAKALVSNILSMEVNAIAVARLFEEKKYLSLPELKLRLKSKRLPAIRIETLAAFFAGYASAESFDSDFDLEVFGDLAILNDGKAMTMTAIFRALLQIANEHGVLELSARGPQPKWKDPVLEKARKEALRQKKTRKHR